MLSGIFKETPLRDILDLRLKMKDPRVELVAAMNSLRDLAKDRVRTHFDILLLRLRMESIL